MSEDVGEKTKNSLYWNVLLKVPYEVFRFGTSIFVARILEPKDFGIVSIATMVIYYANTITNLGLNQALVQRKEITERQINSVFTIDLTISILLVAIFYGLAPYVAVFFKSPESMEVIRVVSFIFILTTFQELPHALLRRELNFKVVSIINISREVAMSALTLLLAFKGFGYWSIVWGSLLPLLVSSVYMGHKAGWVPKISYHHESARKLFHFGIWSFVNSQVHFFSTRIDRIVLGKFLGPSLLGLYDKAKGLSQMPRESIGGNINTVFFSSFSRSQKNDEELAGMLKKGLMITSLLCFPLYFGLFAVSEQFVIVLLGEKWRAAILPLQILCAGGLIESLNGILANFVIGTGNYQKYTVRIIFSTVFLFLMSLFFVKWGIAAVAVGVVLYWLVQFFLTFSLLQEKISFSLIEYTKSIMPALLCSLIMFFSIQLAYSSFFENMNFLNLVSLVVIGISVYATSVLIIPSSNLAYLRNTILSDVKARFNKA